MGKNWQVDLQKQVFLTNVDFVLIGNYFNENNFLFPMKEKHLIFRGRAVKVGQPVTPVHNEADGTVLHKKFRVGN